MCEVLETRKESWLEEFEMLRRFISISDPATIELWYLPDAQEPFSRRFWTTFASLSADAAKARLVIHDLVTGRFGAAPYRDVTIFLSEGWIISDSNGDAERSLAMELGLWLSNVVHLDSVKLTNNPLNEITSPKLAIWGLLGCPCGCDAMWCPENDVQVIIKRISRRAKKHLESSSKVFSDQLGLSIDDRIKAIFDANRLEICGEPCDAYEDRSGETQR